MARPKKICYGCYTIPVTYHRGCVTHEDGRAVEDESGSWGELWLGPTPSIAVTTTLYDIPKCLLHELLHLVYECTGVRRILNEGEQEMVIEATANGITELLRRNPALADYLIKGDE